MELSLKVEVEFVAGAYRSGRRSVSFWVNRFTGCKFCLRKRNVP